jgi:phosphohistidine phosphatase
MAVSWQFNKSLLLQNYFWIDGVKTLLLLRHAKSAWSDPRLDDHQRPLNGRGERAAKVMADHIARQAARPELILCSTAMRTRQTLAPVLKRLGPPAPPVSLEDGLYLASEQTLLGYLRAVPNDVSSVLLIAHNDGIGDLAKMLAGSGPPDALARLREKYPTGALATLRVPDRPWRDLAPGSAELVAFVLPRDLLGT